MFAEMPLDNRTVNKFAAKRAILVATSGFSGRLELRRRRNDRMFCRGWQFCNIEPKICQYG